MAVKSKKAESGILASVHKTAAGLQKIGLMDKAMMREFDALCLTPGELESDGNSSAAGT